MTTTSIRSPTARRTATRVQGPDVYCAVYLRRSTQDRQEGSIGDQLRSIITWVRHEHPDYRISTILEDSQSGQDADRPGYLKLMQLAKSPERPFSRVITYRMNRLSRANPLQALGDLIALVTAGVEVIAVADKLIVNAGNFGNIQSLIMVALQASESHEYVVRLSQDTTRGQVSGLSRKLRQGGRAPYGYRRCVVDDAGELIAGPNGKKPWILLHGVRPALRTHHIRLIPGPAHEVETVQRIFKMRIEGASTKRIALTLNRLFEESGFSELLAAPSYSWEQEAGRLSAPVPAFRWTATSIWHILHSPTYAGTLTWGRQSPKGSLRPGWDAKVKKGSRKWNDPDSWTVVRDAHPALISQADYEAAQARTRTEGAEPRHTSPTHLLVGFGRCKACGAPLWAIRKHILRRHRNDDPSKSTRIFTYLACSSRDRGIDSGCKGFLINESRAMKFLLEILRRQGRHLPSRSKLKAAVRAKIARQLSQGHEDRERRNREVAQVAEEIERLLDQVAKGLLAMSDKFVSERYEALRAKHKTLTEAPAAPVDKAEVERIAGLFADRATALFKDFGRTFVRAPLELQRAHLRQVLDRFEADPSTKTVKFYLRDLPALRLGDSPVRGPEEGARLREVTWDPAGQGERKDLDPG